MTTFKLLLSRLKKAGIDEPFVRRRILPDWWEDSIADEPAGFEQATVYISRMTGASLSALREKGPLRLLPATPRRFKKRVDTLDDEVFAASAIAERVAAALSEAVRPPPPFIGPKTALECRRLLLGSGAPAIGLRELTNFAWTSGIIVAHLADLPKASKRFDGMALFVGNTPVVLLASGRTSPAWIAFHLAHELGHVFLQHVRPGGDPLSDISVDARSEDPEEKTANAFGSELLTGEPSPHFAPMRGVNGDALAVQARALGKAKTADPGVIALMYGWSANRMGVAQNALKALQADDGAHEVIAAAIRSRLQEGLPESLEIMTKLAIER